MIDLRLGSWQDVLADIECDAVICDPPFSQRTHELSAAAERSDSYDPAQLSPSYIYMDNASIAEFCGHWSVKCKGWIVALCDHHLIPIYQREYERAGLYSFAPLPCVMRGMSIRLCGDGPSSWAVYAMVARPRTREFSCWGTLPGAYVGAPSRNAGGGRGKPSWLMSALIRDYSRKGDLIVDPFAGWGGTLRCAESLGRRAIGAEIDSEAFAEAHRRSSGQGQLELTMLDG